mmetsp:Transcript_22720/g.51421  ORF Transcript_22720/g.51421 Transcript_22720/m.51421 type:complete len:147 (-) Transcript_22720:109-549(-)
MQIAAADITAGAATSGGKKGNKKEKKTKPTKLIQPSGFILLELLIVQAMRDLSQGMTLLLSVLTREERMPKYNSEFTPLQVRFERRFLPFSALVRPRLVTYAEYTHVMTTQLDVAPIADVLKTAGAFASDACKFGGAFPEFWAPIQ